jgi:hypothetical protein
VSAAVIGQGDGLGIDRINYHPHLHFLVTEGGMDEAGVFDGMEADIRGGDAYFIFAYFSSVLPII